ncbi:MAG: hypothetical protein KF781_07880 [Chitinophagaceae bacterium]|nr:hypothetical protein [Chitinophagaceae bacterium]MCW5905675.1 hypothetical protein [Chitinophagaceae bacterium]
MQLSNYDIDFLQYENNFYSNSDSLIEQYPYTKHNYHSVLKYIPLIKSKQFSTNEIAGLLLNNAVRKNSSGGYVLFSTTKKERLINNLIEFDKCNTLSLSELSNNISTLYNQNNL